MATKIKLSTIDNVFQSTLNDRRISLETLRFIFLTYFQIKDLNSNTSFDRQVFLDLLNPVISTSVDLQVRRNLCTIVDRILLDSKCYKGYAELYWLEIGHALWIKDRDFSDDISNRDEKYIGDESQKYRHVFY